MNITARIALTLTLIALSSAAHAVNAYLIVPGVKGDVTEGPYANSIRVLAWSTETSSVVTILGSTDVSPPTARALSILKRFGPSSVALLSAQLSGSRYTTATLVSEVGGRTMRIELSGVYVASIKRSDREDSSAGSIEELMLEFEQMTLRSTDSQGEESACYNFRSNSPC